MKKKYVIWGTTALVLILLIGSVFAYNLYNQYKNTLDKVSISPDPNDPNYNDEDDQTEGKTSEVFENPFVLFLYGIDQREGQNDQGRPDTLMLALIDPDLLKVTLISIPRDSYVSIPGYRGKDKINHSFPAGGVDLTVQTIEKWLDIDIFGHTAIDFEGFRELVDLVGGVDVYVDQSIQYDSTADGTHIRLEKGQQVLDGKNALDFVRARLDNRGSRYYTSDYERMERQQLVLKALGGEIVSLKSLPKIFSMMNVVGNNVTTTLAPDELDFLIRKFYKFNIENLDTTSVQGESLHLNGVWYEEVPQSEVARIHQLVQDFIDQKPILAEEDESAENEKEKEAEKNNG
jgi:LCP family protein required for cell wall assembly